MIVRVNAKRAELLEECYSKASCFASLARPCREPKLKSGRC